jgi:hypothetical protein
VHEGGILGGHTYPVLEVCELHADATGELDALDLKIVRLRDPWGKGGWKGDWSKGSNLWEDYPDIRRMIAKKPKIEGSFWMSWDDICTNFNQLFVSVSLPATPTKVLYNGSWSVGDVRSGAGGSPAYDSFPQNPQYSFSVNEPTRIVASLSGKDDMFAKGLLNVAREHSVAIGFAVMKLTGTKERSTKFHVSKMVGSSVAFVKGRNVAGSFDLLPGRYAVVPCTSKPEQEGAFVLQIAADKVINLEKSGDAQTDADDEESDNEGLGPAGSVGAIEEYESAACEEEDANRALQSLMFMVGDLVNYVKDVGSDVKGLEERCKQAELKLQG